MIERIGERDKHLEHLTEDGFANDPDQYKAVYPDDHADRVIRPTNSDEIETLLVPRLHALNQLGKIALVAGSFDVPHPSHEKYLRRVRAIVGARVLHDLGYIDLDIMDIQKVIASDDLLLYTSIDSNYALDRRKSSAASKGGVKRPIYDWQTRAERVADYTFPTYDNKYRSTVDLVSTEGDRDLLGTPLEKARTIAKEFGPDGRNLIDYWAVFDEHQQDIDDAEAAGFDPIIIHNDKNDIIDPMTGRNFSSSDIIRRAQGNAR